ncbi:nose resistant to fluoxetine protein 6 [Drosophila bipectinata]|uniref:nose resistant to fluoxetine protein 6 n=1 Tax=Drosophila bipectinata TaxID=42026 RepID=UPI0038B3101B
MVRLFVVLWLSSLAMVSAQFGENQLALGKQIPVGDLGAEQYAAISKLRRLSVEFVELFPNITAGDLTGDLSRAGLLSAQECQLDIALLTKDLASFKKWALKMVDSWGFLPAGMLVGNFWDLGNFDECVGIEHAVSLSHRVQGKYCFAKVQLASVVLKTGVCFPASCSASHMDTVLRSLFQNLLDAEISQDVEIVSEATCQTAEKKPYDGITIFTIVLLSVLGALVAASSVYDYFFHQDDKSLNAVVKAFSARANSRALFRLVEPKSNPNVIDCLHGIRCMSFIWVVFAHDYMVFASSPNTNMLDALSWIKSFFSQFVIHGIFAVDTFFFLSGMLLVVIALRTMERTKGKLNIPMMYLQRYVRLTPLVAFAILLYLKILPLLGDGPLFGQISFDSYASCEANWLWTLLYVQNYATRDMCLSHSWYLAVDMQLFIFAPFLLIALFRWGKKAAASIFILMLLLASCLFSMMVIKNMSMNGSEEGRAKLYYTPNVRASPYLVGILFGYFLHLTRGKKFNLNPITVLLGWLVALALIFTCLIAVYRASDISIVEEALFVSLTRIAWPLGLCWVVFACMNGYGYLADSFLSSPLWQPMSRLSYAAYIFHMFIESLNSGITRTSTYFSDYQVMLRFWADLGFTMILSYLMHILVEAPFANLVTIMMSPKNPKSASDETLQTKSAPTEEAIEPPSEAPASPPLTERKENQR